MSALRLRKPWPLLVVVTVTMAGCGIFGTNPAADAAGRLQVDFVLEELPDRDLIGVTPRFTNEGDRRVRIVNPDHCIQDLRVHGSGSGDSPVVWRRVDGGDCLAYRFPDIDLGPGGTAEGPGMGISPSALAEEGVEPGSQFVSYRWPVTVEVKGDRAGVELAAPVTVLSVPEPPSTSPTG